MRKPVLTSFGVLVGALVISLAIMALLRFMAQAKPRGGAAGATPSSLSSSYPIRFHDALNRDVVIPSRPQRVISLAPSMTELVFALGAGDRLVANTRFCLHPDEAKTRTKVGGIMDPDMEKILALRPDLVVGSALTPQEVVGQLDRLGLRSVYFRHTTIESVFRDTVDLATLLGERERGVALVTAMRRRQEELTARLKPVSAASRPKVLLLLRIDGLFSAGKGTFPHELIEMAGGENVASRAATAWPQLSMETVIESNPDVIFVAIGPGKVDADFVTKNWQQMRSDPRWSQIKAVANNRFVPVLDDLMTVPGPRLMEALEAVERGLHPELFTDAKKTATP